MSLHETTPLLSVLGNAAYICVCIVCIFYICALDFKRILKFTYPCKIMCI